MGGYSRVGAYLSESSSRVGAYSNKGVNRVFKVFGTLN